MAKWGDLAVELDALPAEVLQTRLKKELANRLDLAALAEVRELEETERVRLVAALASA